MSKQIEYIDTGVNWLGQIPSTWESKRIKMLTRVKRGASPRPIDNPIYFDEEGEFAWVRIADVTASERYLESTTQRLSELGSSLSVKRYPDDFFLSIAGTVGKPIITKIKCCIHDGFVYFPDLKINPEFLYYIFSTGLPYLGLGKMGTQLNLNTDTVGDIYIPIPDEKEIDAIVKYLDDKTFQIDSIINKKQTLIERLLEERNAIITKAVTKGLNPKSKLKSSNVYWLGEIPTHWNVKKLKYVSLVQPSNVDKKSNDKEIPVRLCNYVDVYKNEFITEDIDFMQATAKEDEIQKFKLKIGDVLITKDSETPTDIAVPAYVKIENDDLVCGYHLAQIRANEEEILGEYIFRMFQSKDFNSNFEIAANGITRYGLGLDAIKSVLIPIPPKEEQKEIVEFILSEVSKIDVITKRITQEIELIKEYRTSLINEVVTGKITLNE